MRLRTRFLIGTYLLFVVAMLAIAHMVVVRLGAPSYRTPCSARSSNMLVLGGFGSTSPPRMYRACAGGKPVPTVVSIDGAGDLVIESTDPSLSLFDGRRSPDDVRVLAGGYDHSKDAPIYRLLELATPFAELDKESPYGGGEESMTTVEVGRPRVERTPTNGVRLRMDVGPILDDRSASLVIMARPTSK